VYRNLIYRRFSITREAGAMAMRLLQHEVVFNELEAADHNGTLCGYISKESIGNSLHHIFERRRCLDATEVRQMTDFALTEVTKNFEQQEDNDDGGLYGALVAIACEGLTHFGRAFKEAFGLVKHPTDHSDLEIDVDKFTSACSSIEPISFDHVVKLFDRDRKISRMERFFMPTHFQMCLSEIRRSFVKAQADEEAQSKDAIQKRHIDLRHAVSDVQRVMTQDLETVDMLNEEVPEERHQIDMLTDQINVLTLRLDEQQRKHDMEQFQAQQEMDGVKAQITNVVQVLGSLQLLGFKAMDVEEAGSSSKPCVEV